MIIHYDNRPAGDGKTHDQLSRICGEHGLYLFAVDRREIIAEREATLAALAAVHGINIATRAVHHPVGNEHGPIGGVRVAIEGLCNTYTSGHVVIWITHAGLKSANLGEFSGWHLVIDETPSVLDRDTLNTRISRDLLASMFDLDPEGDFSKIVPARVNASTTRAIAGDTLAGPLATLHGAVLNDACRVLTHLKSWSELERRPRWTWWSLWSPAALEAFDTVTILAAAFDRSLTYDLCQKLHSEIKFQKMEASSASAYTPRTLIVRYFAQEHVATRHLFNSEAGKGYIAKVAGHLRTISGPMIWTCNKPELATMLPYLQRGWLSPRQAGSNAWSHFDVAVAVYTSKPDVYERRLLKSLDVDPDRMTETRERETIYQFVGRTSLRDRHCDRDVVAYVYDQDQAAALGKAFDANPNLTVTLELVDLGFAQQVHGHRATASLSDEEKAERIRVQARERERAKRQRDRGSADG